MADAEMKEAPSAARTTGLRTLALSASLALPRSAGGTTSAALAVRSVSSYGTDMSPTLGGRADSSQSHFDADQLEAMDGCAELINSGRSGSGDLLPDLEAVQSFADRYAFYGVPAELADL